MTVVATRFLLVWAVLVGGLLGMPGALGVTIHWGSAVGDFIYESDGTTLVDPSSFQFELGTFADGFMPTEANMADWEANWHRLDIGSYSQTTGTMAGSVTLLNTPTPDGTILDGDATDPASFFFGKDAYVWVYNQNTTIDSTLEWALLSNPDGDGIDPATAWTFPTAPEAGAHTEVREFRLSDEGVTANFGEETGGGTTTTGEGQRDMTPATLYGIQTFTIPEPSTTGLLLLGGVFGILFSRRRCES